MSTNDNKLISDHEEVVKIIRNYDKINLINTSGEPVDEYDIEYKLKGYTNALDGSIRISSSHRIKIKLPFGYPHFHPTVKPLSPIFHPDIDDFAIRIAHRWEKDKSLPNLVLFIGHMICGKEYSTENPFNLAAAKYYEENKPRLPLDSIEQPRKATETDDEKDPISLSFLGPVIKVLLFIFITAGIGAGVLYFSEKKTLEKASGFYRKAQRNASDQEYSIAEMNAQKALDNLGSFYLLQAQKNSLVSEIESFIQSTSFQEGLRGKIKYGDSYLEIETVHKLELLQEFTNQALELAAAGKEQGALEKYEEAIDYAEKNNLQNSLSQVKENLADLKLKVLVAASEQAHQTKNWEFAISQHKKVLEYIDKESQFLKTGKQQYTKTSHLLLLGQIAFYTQLASVAEENNDLQDALKNHNMIISLIGKAESDSNPTLKNTLIDSMRKAALLSEKFNLQQRREWLLENYKEVFVIHYPTIIPETLSNPQAIFVKYDEKNPIFDLSCLDKSQGSVVRLRLFVQYNPDTGGWSAYKGQIE